jgi:nucleotide-binding universal stress UspA family protein
MTFVDRYWEWRRRRAMRAWNRAREQAALAERCGVWGRRDRREQKPQVGESEAASGRCDHGSSWRDREGLQGFGQAGPDRLLVQQTECEARKAPNTPDRDASGYSTILVAIDGSESSVEVGKEAVELARSLRAALVVLSTLNAELAFRAGIYRTLALAELERDGGVIARQTKELADKSGVECEVWSAREGRPSRAIVGVAEEVGAGCIVIGSPGTSAVDRLFARALGGTHDKVLRQARCPVLSVVC